MSAARAVFDCMLFVQAAARASGPAGACLDLVKSGRVDLFMSPDAVAEVSDVLNRPRTRAKFPSLMPAVVAAFLDDVLAYAHLIAAVPDVFHLDRDPKDSRYINLAVAAGASHLVSRDKDLLDLMNSSVSQHAQFRKVCPVLKILDPAAFLREISL